MKKKKKNAFKKLKNEKKKNNLNFFSFSKRYYSCNLFISHKINEYLLFL